MKQHPGSSHAQEGPQPQATEAKRQENPSSLAQCPALCQLHSCSLPSTADPGYAQGIPMSCPLELGNTSGTEEGWEGACPGELLQGVLQKSTLTSRRAGFGFFSGHQPGLLLRWGRWSCSAGWGGTEPRLAKLGWHRPRLSQMPPHGTAEGGHRGSSLWWWL